MSPFEAKRACLVAAAALAATAFFPPPSHATPTTVRYPSSVCPDSGDNGLQNCINSVEPGSTVILVDEVIREAAVVTKSLNLVAADRSLQPILASLTIAVEIKTGPIPIVDAVVEGIRVDDFVSVVFEAGSGHVATLRRIKVGTGSGSSKGVYMRASVPASFTLEESFVRRNDANGRGALELTADDPNGPVMFRIVGNRITARGDTNSGEGVYLYMQGSGSVRAEIMNNVVSDVATCNCGAASGIAVLPYDEIRADVNIVGNTIVHSHSDAIQQRNDLTTGRLSLDVFNNIFSHNEAALSLDSGGPGSLVFRAGSNAYFANEFPSQLDGQSIGTGNLKVDPRYVDPAKRKLSLRPDSPLIDKGLICSPGGVANPDAAGRHRLEGLAVDIGAYERDAPKVTGVVRVGTDGKNELAGTKGSGILCGLGGADVLRGGAGSDYLDPGKGADRAIGGSGDDTLCTRDGKNGDRADGGSGADKARTDNGDTRISIEASASC